MKIFCAALEKEENEYLKLTETRMLPFFYLEKVEATVLQSLVLKRNKQMNISKEKLASFLRTAKNVRKCFLHFSQLRERIFP